MVDVANGGDAIGEALAINERVFKDKPDHPALLVTRDNLIAALQMQDKTQEAAALEKLNEPAAEEKPAAAPDPK